jgi:hypothetical protein
MMLMVYHRKKYSEMEAHLKSKPPAPGVGTEEGSQQVEHPRPDRGQASTPSQRLTMRLWRDSKNLGRARKKHVAIDSSGLGIRRRSAWHSIRTHSSPSKKRDFCKLHLAYIGVQADGEAHLLLDAHVRKE